MIFQIDLKKNKILGIDKFVYKRSYFNKKYELFFFGNFRTPINKIDDIILNFKEKNFNKNNIEKIFRKIGGICTIIIFSNDEIKICASLFHPFLKIFKKDENYIVTDDEFIDDKKMSSNDIFLKLMTHHSYFFHKGISNNAIDFISPGSFVTFKKNNPINYEFDWYLKFEEFCSRDDHDKIVEDLEENYFEVFDNLNQSKKYFFALSSGLDSALSFGVSQKKNNVTPMHITRGVYDDELDGASNIAKFFKKKLIKKYMYGNKYTTLDFNDDIYEQFDYWFNNLNHDSIFHPLHSHSVFIKSQFPNSHIFSGTSDPLLLGIHHMMVYPNRNNVKMDYSHNKEKRYFYSIEFFKKFKNSSFNDFYDLSKNFSNIHPYYIPLLNCFVDQLTKQYDFREKYLNNNNLISSDNSSPVRNLKKETYMLMSELKKDKAKFVIKKILKSKFFEIELKTPNERTAQILLKFFHFLGQYGKENHQCSLMHDNINIFEPTALNGPICLTQLSVLIDKKLTNYSKWHMFRLFKKIHGIEFDNIYKRQSLLNPKFVLGRIHSKLSAKFKKLPEQNDKFALINNTSLKKFIFDKKIFEKYNDMKSNHEFSNLMYNFPTKDELLETKNVESNFWKLNNIINISSKL